MTAKSVVADVSLLGKMAGYIETLVRDPQSPVFVPLCEIYLQFGLLDEALDVARRGTARLPAHAPGFAALGRVLAEQSQPAAAEEAFRTALALDAALVPALTGMARIALSRGDYRAAIAALQQARQSDPADEVAAQLLSVASKLASVSPVVTPPAPVVPAPLSAPAAVTLPEPVAAGSAPGDEEIEELDEAEVAEIAPLPENNAPIATATIADIYIRQGFPEKALKVYADLLQTEPGNAELRARHDRLAATIESGQAPALSSGATPAAAVPPSPPAGGEVALLAVYERWLTAIEQRRAHVQ